jgi:integrase/recombinase XerC
MNDQNSSSKISKMHAHLDEFIKMLQERKASAATVRAYKADLELGWRYFTHLGITDPKKVDKFAIRGYLAMLKDQRLKNATFLRKLSSLRSFFKHLVAMEHIAVNPVANVASPRKDQRIPNFLTQNELEKIIVALCRAKDPLAAARNRAWIELVYSSGIRVAESAGMDIEDIDFWNKTLRVIGKGNKERLVPVGSIALKAVREYLALRKADILIRNTRTRRPLFLNLRYGTRLTTRAMHQIIEKAAREAGVRRRIGPHVVRHTFATHLVDAGCDLRSVQEMLGHKSLSTTQIYAHVTPERLQKVYKKAHPRA